MNADSRGNSCKRCGRCMAVCPVYQTTFREADVARGRLAILQTMREDVLRGSSRFSDILSRCLMCGACGDVCANNLKAADVIQAGRQMLHRVRWMENPVAKTIRRGGLSERIVCKGGALLQALSCKKIPDTSGLHLRFPLSFFAKRHAIPAISWKPFVKDAQGACMGQKQGSPRVAVFAGCGGNYLFQEAAWALVRVLRRMDVNVVVPQDQVCCGLPAYVSGDMSSAKRLARKNIEAFASLDVDAVLTICASCGSHLGSLGKLFVKEPSVHATAKVLAEKHRDAMVFLCEQLSVESYLKRDGSAGGVLDTTPMRVVYHDPCHLRIGQGGTQAPRKILGALQGVELVETAHPNRCCGHGGGFNLAHFQLSMKILERRMQDFQAARPDAIVTGCTGCLLQFAEAVARKGLAKRVKVCHPLVLVERALGGGNNM